MENEELVANSVNAANTLIDRIIILYLRHNFSLVCLEDLMELLNVQRENCEKLPTHKKQILKLFRENKDMIEVIYFIRCAKCNKIFEKSSEDMVQVKCCNVILKKTETNFYVYMPLKKQIIQSVNRNWQDIQNFDTSRNEDDGSVSDAHDGDILKNVLKEYENDDLNILSLCVNVDGANKFDSNLLSLWPIQFTQNYLPPKIRFLPENILVSGLLYTEKKFDFREYFLPIIKELHSMKENKIVMTIKDVLYTFQPVVTHCAVDLPAKSKFQETTQFGGYDACTYCEIPGVPVHVSSKSNKSGRRAKTIQQIRYPEGNESYRLRDEKETLKKMLAVSSSNKMSLDGVKGKIFSYNREKEIFGTLHFLFKFWPKKFALFAPSPSIVGYREKSRTMLSSIIDAPAACTHTHTHTRNVFNSLSCRTTTVGHVDSDSSLFASSVHTPAYPDCSPHDAVYPFYHLGSLDAV